MLLLSLLLSCSEPPPPPPTPTPAEQAPPKLDLAAMLKAGKYGEASEEALKNLAAKADDTAAWDALLLAGSRSGKASELVDKLAMDQAIGGQTGPHHTVRAALALLSGRPADALNSALALEAISPGDAAALAFAAIQAGTPAPATPSPALTALLSAAKDPKKALDTSLMDLQGWRIALVRGDLLLARGDRAGAMAEAAKAETGALPGKIEAARLKIRSAENAETAWSVATAAADTLSAEDSTGATLVLLSGEAAALALWKAPDLVQKATDLAAKSAPVDKKDPGNPHANAMASLLKARAALRAGQPLAASEAATVAAQAELPLSFKQQASWTLALAEAMLGGATAVETAAAGCDEAHKAAALELASVLKGEPTKLPSAGLSGDEAALQALLGYGWSHDARALQSAQSAASPDLQLWAALLQDRKKLPAGLSSVPEAAARSFIAGTGVPPEEAPFAAPLTRARNALATGDTETALREYGSFAIVRPAWRTGPWEPVLAMDGLLPSEFGFEEARFTAQPNPLPYQVVLHGWSHRVLAAQTAWTAGISPFPAGTLPDKARAVWDATSSHRYASLAWLAGKGAAPTETRNHLDGIEQDAGLSSFQSPSLTSLRNNLNGSALFSFREHGGKVEVLVLTEATHKVLNLPGSFTNDTRKYLDALSSGAAVALGDKLRSQLIDPLQDSLLGVGRYFSVGTGALGAFPFTSLPEQSDGLRYLVAIRSVAHYQTFDQVIPASDAPGDTSIDVLGLCATQAEADYLARSFPNTQLFVGANATLAAWREHAGKARFLHIGGFPNTPGGNIKLSDGVLTASELASTPLSAGIAYIRASKPDTAMMIGRALKRAGVDEVMLQGWGTRPAFDERMMTFWWELQAGRAAVGRSLSEARPRAFRESEPDILTMPDVWGGFYILGKL